MKMFTAAERLAKALRPKIMIVGRPGVGKTSRLRTLTSELLSTTLLIDLEAGTLPVDDLGMASIEARTWPDMRDIAVAISGPNPAKGTGAYSPDHHRAVIDNPALAGLAKFDIIDVDSLTEATRICRAWAEQQPEGHNQFGKKDLRGVYGLVARELIVWVQQLQHAREKTLILTAILEQRVDDLGVKTWGIQAEGRRIAAELPAVLDVILILDWVRFSDGNPRRAFICDPHDSRWGQLIKDRSGKLAKYEEPNLQKLLTKLTTRQPT
jgi:hypothetical protein